MAKNVFDGRLVLHQRITDILVDLFAAGEGHTVEDVDVAAEITDALLLRLGVSIVQATEKSIVFDIPIV